MKTLDLNIGADVFCRDGKCGKLAKYAVNRDAWLVARLIVEDGVLLKRGRVFPLASVERATAGEIQLSIGEEELPNYPEYREEVIEQPAPGGAGGDPMRAAGPYGQTGVAAVPTVREKVRYGVPDELAVVERGTPIEGPEGRVGKLDHFLVNAAKGEITHLVAQQGVLFSTKRLIPVSMVESISEGGVFIAATEEVLKGLPEYDPEDVALQATPQAREAEIEDPGGRGTNNHEIDLTTRVSMALMEDPQTSDAIIEVIDDRGVITLQGEVDDVETRDAAVALAGEQPGVISVVSSLQVKQ